MRRAGGGGGKLSINTLKSCCNFKKFFFFVSRLYLSFSSMYLFVMCAFSLLYFSFSLDVWYCFAWSFTFYHFLYCIYICILWIYFFSLCSCTPFSLFKIIFPPISLLYLFTFCIIFLRLHPGKIHCLRRSHWQHSHMPKLGFESLQRWVTATSQWQSHKVQCTVYTHCGAKCDFPVYSVIRAALGQLMAMLLINIVSIDYMQGISVDP